MCTATTEGGASKPLIPCWIRCMPSYIYCARPGAEAGPRGARPADGRRDRAASRPPEALVCRRASAAPRQPSADLARLCSPMHIDTYPIDSPVSRPGGTGSTCGPVHPASFPPTSCASCARLGVKYNPVHDCASIDSLSTDSARCAPQSWSTERSEPNNQTGAARQVPNGSRRLRGDHFPRRHGGRAARVQQISARVEGVPAGLVLAQYVLGARAPPQGLAEGLEHAWSLTTPSLLIAVTDRPS